jgi:hypothetical protein
MDIINEVLARRTFAESGNYIVSGFELKELDYERKIRQMDIDTYLKIKQIKDERSR